MKVVLVCRMGSARFPGKSLAQFGEETLLSHIIARVVQGGIGRGDICIATSDNVEDAPIIREAARLGCCSYAGSSADVSRRILGATEGAADFLLILGDNPWIDPGQVAELVEASAERDVDYLVTATQELPPKRWPDRLYPVGTRLQYIRRAFMDARLKALDSADVQEHTSKLFLDLPEDARAEVLSPVGGWPAETLGGLNISINTEADYVQALKVLASVGPAAPTRDVAAAYLRLREEAS